jgi:hypothetical protein
MPFGLHKSDKQPERESDPAKDEALESGQGVGAADAEGNGSSPADQLPAEGQPQEAAPNSKAFRPVFLDSDAPSERAPAVQPPKGDAFFVSVTRNGGTENHRFDGPSQAQTFVEQLLEEGVPQEEVTVFTGRRATLKVTHRPVVKLATSQDD